MKLVLICMSFGLVLVTAWNLRCSRRADYGDCKGHQTKWTYSKFENKCIRFDYSGCGGNNNRFISRFECELICYAIRFTNTRPPQSLEGYRF
ncbi:kunitz-type serine protease inhibitor-like [Drosophila serrata]|uniref:kunitz-type serine protease inhibitor-like n=1 Tax=Drosophila serrata TaxID=7274 RepID=UPI000A1D349F|nr:kunitz-type serine protease inhibitor-like [Drosophila serrata]